MIPNADINVLLNDFELCNYKSFHTNNEEK